MISIVGEEEDEGVVGDPSVFERAEDLPDGEVQAMDHGCEYGARRPTRRIEDSCRGPDGDRRRGRPFYTYGSIIMGTANGVFGG